MTKSDTIWLQRRDQFSHLSESILFDLARNQAAEPRMREAAMEIMLEKGFRKAHVAEVADVLAAVERKLTARAEVEAIVESAVETPIEDVPGPFQASVTTQTMLTDGPEVQAPVEHEPAPVEHVDVEHEAEEVKTDA